MIRFVLSTFPDEETASRIVRELVEGHHAACGTIIPKAKSIYRWQGNIEEASEAMVIFKIPTENFVAFQKALLGIHPYETPEIAAFEAKEVSKAYAKWVLECCPESRL